MTMICDEVDIDGSGSLDQKEFLQVCHSGACQP